jgi:hypothetical protein
MDVIEAPNPFPQHSDVFLGGGISGCPDWQTDAIYRLRDIPGTVLNPRREGEFTEAIAYEQITWEYHALRTADTVFFWFPMETLCPITLFELGVFTQRKDTRLIVGVHPDYARRFDVIRQLELARPEVDVQDNIFGLVEEYKRSLRAEHKLDSPEDQATLLHETEQNEYKRVENIVQDELELLIGHGTITDLHKVLKDNYKNLTDRHVSSVLADRRNKDFYLTSDGRMLSPRK